jgi:hypothetical protein
MLREGWVRLIEEEDLIMSDEAIDALTQLEAAAAFPAKPNFNVLTQEQKIQKYGDPLRGVVMGANERSFIPNGEWRRTNIRKIAVGPLMPSCVDVKLVMGWFHGAVVDSAERLFRAWEKAGVADRIDTWNGSAVYRKTRGGQRLSSHAFGIAFDINAATNPFGVIPSSPGKAGCVYELVKIANAEGWYWGGHFSKPDGMHFEYVG